MGQHMPWPGEPHDQDRGGRSGVPGGFAACADRGAKRRRGLCLILWKKKKGGRSKNCTVFLSTSAEEKKKKEQQSFPRFSSFSPKANHGKQEHEYQRALLQGSRKRKREEKRQTEGRKGGRGDFREGHAVFFSCLLALSLPSSQAQKSNIYLPSNSLTSMERSYHPESSGSRPITEDKLGWARLVLR